MSIILKIAQADFLQRDRVGFLLIATHSLLLVTGTKIMVRQVQETRAGQSALGGGSDGSLDVLCILHHWRLFSNDRPSDCFLSFSRNLGPNPPADSIYSGRLGQVNKYNIYDKTRIMFMQVCLLCRASEAQTRERSGDVSFGLQSGHVGNQYPGN